MLPLTPSANLVPRLFTGFLVNLHIRLNKILHEAHVVSSPQMVQLGTALRLGWGTSPFLSQGSIFEPQPMLLPEFDGHLVSVMKSNPPLYRYKTRGSERSVSCTAGEWPGFGPRSMRVQNSGLSCVLQGCGSFPTRGSHPDSGPSVCFSAPSAARFP